MGSLGRIKNWVAEVLTFADLNAEFDNILNNADTLSSPRASAFDMNGNEITLDVDSDTSITASTDDQIDFELRGVDLFVMDGHTNGTTVTGLKFYANSTGAAPVVEQFLEDDIGIAFSSKNGEEMLILAATAAAVNEVTITSAATIAAPTILATGETDVPLTIGAKGTGSLSLRSGATGSVILADESGNEILIAVDVASAVNEVTITNAATGVVGPILAATGETDVGLNVDAKGAGQLKLGAAGTGTTLIGNAQIAWPNTDGAANSVLITNGSAASSFAAATYASGPASVSVLPLPRNYLAGFGLTRTDANTITVAAGQARNTGDDTNLIRSTTLAKDIDATWVAGAGGGLNATDFASGGSDAEADTWYHVFVIENGSGTVDAGFDKSVTATNLLSDSGYTKYRRIGSVLTNVSKDILDFKQNGDLFRWDVSVTEPNIANLNTTVASTQTLTQSPLGIRVLAKFYLGHTDGSAVQIHVYPTDQTDQAAVSQFAISQSAANDNMWVEILTDTTQGVRFFGTNADVGSIHLSVLSWTDRRGRDD